MAWFERTMAEFFLLLKAPLYEPEMWWIVAPLIAIVLVMTFYFGKYIREQLGWNTALGNSIVLFFICMDLLRTIYHYSSPPTFYQFLWNPMKTVVVIAVMFEGILLSATAFEHALPKQIMFFIASPVSVNTQAYVLAAVVYLQLVPSIYTLLAAILLFLVLFGLLRTLQEVEHLQRGYHFQGKKTK
jgi:hypothetical protein